MRFFRLVNAREEKNERENEEQIRENNGSQESQRNEGKETEQTEENSNTQESQENERKGSNQQGESTSNQEGQGNKEQETEQTGENSRNQEKQGNEGQETEQTGESSSTQESQDNKGQEREQEGESSDSQESQGDEGREIKQTGENSNTQESQENERQESAQQGESNSNQESQDNKGQETEPTGENSNTQEEQNNKEKEEFDKSETRKSFKELLNNKDENISTKKGIEIGNLEELKDEEIPDSVINMIIEKFLNTTFIPGKTDLNSRRESLIPTVGDLKWNIPDLIRHKLTKQYNQMLHDKYGHQKEDGEDEKIPLSFYFDLSGSMEEYSRVLALMTFKLLKKDIKVLVGGNEYVEYQIDKISKNLTVDDVKKIFENYYILKNRDMKVEPINKTIDEYLKEKEGKKVVVFSDFDPKEEVENLSEFAEVYWFCFEERDVYKNTSLKNFKGHFYNTKDIKDLLKHLKNIKNRYYERLQRQQREGGRGLDD